MSDGINRNRAAKNPGGMVCMMCGLTFIGEDWHALCRVCFDEQVEELKLRDSIKTAKGTSDAEG